VNDNVLYHELLSDGIRGMTSKFEAEKAKVELLKGQAGRMIRVLSEVLTQRLCGNC
jgi:hypothetical protein